MDTNADILHAVDHTGNGVRLLDIARIHGGADWHFAEHSHEFAQFLLVLSGGVTVRLAGAEHETT